MAEECFDYDAQRRRLSFHWLKLGVERDKLSDLPVGDVDPVERQRLIDDEMDAVEQQLDALTLREKKGDN